MKRIENIFSKSLMSQQSSTFSFCPDTKAKMLGLLISPNVSLSISVNGGADLLIDSTEINTSIDSPPKSRIIPFDMDLSLIKGKVENKTANQNKANIYLITE